MDQVSLASLLEGLPVPAIRYSESIESTNDAALAWAADGAAEGCLVAADRQTRGRGRLGRRWITQPGEALAFSLILQPTAAEADRLGLFSPLGALAICQALEERHGLSPQIKWPNDVLLQRRKVAGILVETSWVGEQVQGLVIGIGVNVSRAAVPPEEMLLFPATSVEQAAGQQANRMELLRDILSALFAWRGRIRSADFHRQWEQRLAFRDEWVQIEAAAGDLLTTGQVSGISRDGALLLRDAQGAQHAVAAGDVHLRPV
jgi:BirA family transcriptional regulator, biotin operon repressor / biotin---[acetyl-CoA-carboxylase] ligase